MTYNPLYPNWVEGGLIEAKSAVEQAQTILDSFKDKTGPYQQEIARMLKLRQALLKVWQDAREEL